MKQGMNYFIVCALIVICGCSESNRPYAKRKIVCENLYQGNSIEDAMKFTGSPEDIREKNKKFLLREGKLAQGKELAFANRLFNVGRTRNIEDYKSLLSDKMKELLAANDKHSLVIPSITKIKEGHAFSAPCENDYHGKCDANFIAAFDKFEHKGSDWYYFPDNPTHKLSFWHFHKPNYSLIGSMLYVVKEHGEYKLVLASLTNKEAPEFEPHKKFVPVNVSGIEKKYLQNIADKSFHRWAIGITEADNKNNIIEIIRTSRPTTNEKPGSVSSEEVLVGYDSFEKFAKVWDSLRFDFKVDFESAGETNFGKDKSSMKYGFSIATSSKSADLMYHGKEISNLDLNSKGEFENGELELFTFKSISENKTVHSNRVFVRLKPKSE